jgi:hypothetical protein
VARDSGRAPIQVPVPLQVGDDREARESRRNQPSTQPRPRSQAIPNCQGEQGNGKGKKIIITQPKLYSGTSSQGTFLIGELFPGNFFQGTLS